MQKCFIIIIALAIILTVFCKKEDPWKMPTDVKFKMDITRSAGLSNNLSWTSGNIVLADFTFDGRREQGGDVYFTKTYSTGLNVIFDAANPVTAWSFEIPQGNYTRIDISYKTFGNSSDNRIVVEGAYKNSVNNNTYPVRFEFQSDVSYKIVAKTSTGGGQIVLNKDVASVATIKMDPVYWFQTVTKSMLDNAALETINGTPTILINGNKNNKDIYITIMDRIDDDVIKITF